jgi:formamidopyrimidine-DNA glycosylase
MLPECPAATVTTLTGSDIMPELPEVESAREVVERLALGRRIVDVDDSDPYVCRPHRPGELRAALVGRRLTSVHRRGKSMWCETSGAGRSRTPGPVLGIHLGMSGRIVVGDARGNETDGGDYWARGRANGDHRFARFSLSFADRWYLMLVDPRRLGRVRLDPPTEKLGPDALTVTLDRFRALMARGSAPVKARLLDQAALAGVGNLLADEALWQARINPARPVNKLSTVDVDRLHRAVRGAVGTAVGNGGVHNLAVVTVRAPGAACPRCGAPMTRSTVGGRTSWWCSREQS